MTSRCEVLGVPLTGWVLKEFVDTAFERMGVGGKTLFTTANAHSIMVAQRNASLLTHFAQATAVLPDGALAVWAGRRLGCDIPERVPGPDFFAAFLERAVRDKVSVCFFGSTVETLNKMEAASLRRWPGLRVVGKVAPPFGAFDAATNRRLVDAVNATRPDALFVGMTAPRQEIWLSQNWDALKVRFGMGVGAAFDFLAGNKRRAPAWLGQRGGEWLFRFALEPRRLWRRNLDSARFISRVLQEGKYRDRPES